MPILKATKQEARIAGLVCGEGDELRDGTIIPSLRGTFPEEAPPAFRLSVLVSFASLSPMV